MCTNKIRGHQTIRNAGINSTTLQCTGETFHSTTMWQVPLPGQSNRQYPVMPDQHTSGTIIQSSEDTMQCATQLLDYLSTQEEAILTYNASDMILAVHSNASYLSKPKARSRAGGHFFLSSNTQLPANNGAILNIAHIIKNVMSLATEAELAALYIIA
jgi:hypothetical protein